MRFSTGHSNLAALSTTITINKVALTSNNPEPLSVSCADNTYYTGNTVSERTIYGLPYYNWRRRPITGSFK